MWPLKWPIVKQITYSHSYRVYEITVNFKTPLLLIFIVAHHFAFPHGTKALISSFICRWKLISIHTSTSLTYRPRGTSAWSSHLWSNRGNVPILGASMTMAKPAQGKIDGQDGFFSSHSLFYLRQPARAQLLPPTSLPYRHKHARKIIWWPLQYVMTLGSFDFTKQVGEWVWEVDFREGILKQKQSIFFWLLHKILWLLKFRLFVREKVFFHNCLRNYLNSCFCW